MRHPSTRAARRYARACSLARRQSQIRDIYTRRGEDPTRNLGWNKGGKQYTACGNRCAHSMADRFLARQKVKHLRRWQ